MITYNGYKPGETYTKRMRARKADKGHSIVAMTTTRRGHDFSFKVTAECECGKKFSTTRDRTSLLYRHEAHQRTEASKVGA